ncbi:S8/S53 family peptidase [Thalassobius sp. Cn5-15]|uniref:S8/S53 family peptidase n=1 Tax=Thalassobius sp. Cn5-15 TaxID=2917763 RepID=UPI001EF2D63D|nr:S8/S53 family peptidase [Thalassobius sp. Cn5-15]MCG7491969.1 S8/S53 family peptidase [Thalassobius sp. Cn5-15]
MNTISANLTGNALYPNYDALWHLHAMGILDQGNEPKGWSLSKPQKPTRVAVIDTSAAIEHPNLQEAINKELSLDLFSARLGSFPYRGEGKTPIDNLDLNWSTNIADGLPRTVRLLAEFVDRLSHGSPAHFSGVQPCTDPAFSNHGTSIAGLVGARACMAEQKLPNGSTAPLPLPYCGVDPMCEIVQISTNFDPDPESLLLAFLYADLIDADVVLFPRNIADPTRTVPELGDELVSGAPLGDAIQQIAPRAEKAELWSELSELMVTVSQHRPVVCAAGNANEDNAIYPANLASEHNGIVSVGALNAKGVRCSYSVSRNVTVLAPSGDAEVFDRTQVRLDEQNPNYDPTGVPTPNDNHLYSSFDLISTDVPGKAGYSGSPFDKTPTDGSLREFGSYYSRFSGTSASSALVAGFLSLAKSTNALQAKSGIEAKAWLLAKSEEITADGETFLMPVWSGAAVFPDSSTEVS